MISGFGMLAPLLAVLVWADRKLIIVGPGEGVSLGALMNCSRRGDRQPGIRLTGIRRAPYSIRTLLVKEPPSASAGCAFRPDAVLSLDASGRFGQGLRLQGTCAPRSTAYLGPGPTRPSAGSPTSGRW